jgi:hypothetical protein
VENDPGSQATPTPNAAPGPSARDQQLKAAYTAFKKRYKVTVLDDESRLGGGRPVTGGKKSAIAGIVPPREFPADVWAELAKQGRIKDCGGGFYGMP